MEIVIVLPFEDAETQTPVWAVEEAAVDFRRDPDRGARCTLAFAATELKHFLTRTIPGITVSFDSGRPSRTVFIELQVRRPHSKAEAFTLAPCDNGIVITGEGRTGALYGAYEFLRMQGWRWLAPGPAGEIAPPPAAALVMPQAKKEYAPSMSLGRGFDFEDASKESRELYLWMARNRLNLSGYRPATGAFCQKLGMSPKIGGHIFEAILHPDRAMPSGKTLWEEHPEWFGLPKDQVRRKETAQQTQFCVSRPDLLEFLGRELLAYLMGPWKEADRVDLWGFDTWGSTCTCQECRALGNSADQTLHFIAAMRRCLNRAREAGTLDHDVRLVTCAYEGTNTITGPANPPPRCLIEAGDYITFYPINRCYVHDFADGTCSWNAPYAAALATWFSRKPGLDLMIGEYYNVSKFEDLPLLFTRRIMNDLPAYHAAGARGMTYMHLPMVNWGMRTLTQVLYAQLAWDIHTDVPAFLEEYFTLWYGPYAATMRRVYDLVESAWAHVAQWRAWAAKSVLAQLLAWDGRPAGGALAANDHFKTPAGAVETGRRAVAMMQEALALLNQARNEDKWAAARTIGMQAAAVNPIEARRREAALHYQKRLGEDRRGLLYGIDTMTLMTDMVAYHDALRGPDPAAADALWERIEQTAERLDSYYVPISYEAPGPGLDSRDALTRTQLRDVINRCRKFRLETR